MIIQKFLFWFRYAKVKKEDCIIKNLEAASTYTYKQKFYHLHESPTDLTCNCVDACISYVFVMFYNKQGV